MSNQRTPRLQRTADAQQAKHQGVRMTSRQCEIAGESYAACLLAQAGYDVLVQYGANQPHYDLVAVKRERFLPISVKSSQDGGWMLAVNHLKEGVGYHQAIDAWLSSQRSDVVFVFVQFLGVALGTAPRAYMARPREIAAHLKTQCAGRGHGALQEDYRRDRPRSKYDHRIPPEWVFTSERVDNIESEPLNKVGQEVLPSAAREGTHQAGRESYPGQQGAR